MEAQRHVGAAIELLQRAVGRNARGLTSWMVMSMCLFSGISGSKMAGMSPPVGSVRSGVGGGGGARGRIPAALGAGCGGVLGDGGTIPPAMYYLIILGFRPQFVDWRPVCPAGIFSGRPDGFSADRGSCSFSVNVPAAVRKTEPERIPVHRGL